MFKPSHVILGVVVLLCSKTEKIGTNVRGGSFSPLVVFPKNRKIPNLSNTITPSFFLCGHLFSVCVFVVLLTENRKNEVVSLLVLSKESSTNQQALQQVPFSFLFSFLSPSSSPISLPNPLPPPVKIVFISTLLLLSLFSLSTKAHNVEIYSTNLNDNNFINDCSPIDAFCVSNFTCTVGRLVNFIFFFFFFFFNSLRSLSLSLSSMSLLFQKPPLNINAPFKVLLDLLVVILVVVVLHFKIL